jgi:glycopeptide antibiotics resistance protein
VLERGHARRLLVAWFVSTLVLTLAPFGPLRSAPLGLDWVLPAHTRLGAFDFLANIALFLPFGVFGVAAGLRKRMAMTLGLLLSLLIESAQTYLVVRYPSYFDVVANTGGAALGAFLAGPLLALGRRIYTRRVRVALLAAGGVAAVCLVLSAPQVARFGAAFPFAIGVLAGLVASGLWPPRPAFLLAAAATLLACAPLSYVAVAALPGAALGTWPASGAAFLVTKRRLA